MLVCNVSLRPPRSALSAAIAEVANAVDATATGNVVLATLVDDPAFALEAVDAYLGSIMLEAASAVDAVAAAGSVYVGTVVEVASASDAVAATGAVAVSLGEVTTATDEPDATSTAPFTTKQAMVAGPVFINSDGTSRAAYVDGVMVNQ